MGMLYRRVAMCVCFASACMFWADCTTLLDESFKDYVPKVNMDAGQDAAKSNDEKPPSALPAGNGGSAGSDAVVPLGDVCSGDSMGHFDFDHATDQRLEVFGNEVPTGPLQYLADAGSPEPGALALDATFGKVPPQYAVKIGTKLSSAQSLSCISVRVNLDADVNNVDLNMFPGAWYVWASDESSCFAQGELNHDWRYELRAAGVWYELGTELDKLTSQCGRPFDSSAVRAFGLGFSTHTNDWHPRIVLDAFRWY